ncbi:hypothetical protein Bca52824_095619, partial [Brassica carinata]
VLKEFATKKCVKLGKLLKEGGGLELKKKTKKHRKKTDQDHNGRVNPNSVLDPKEDVSNDDTVAGDDSGNGFMRRSYGGGRCGGGWRPALHSIPELGSS